MRHSPPLPYGSRHLWLLLLKWKGMENQHRHLVILVRSNSMTAAAPMTAALQHVERGASFATATRALRTCPQVGCWAVTWECRWRRRRDERVQWTHVATCISHYIHTHTHTHTHTYTPGRTCTVHRCQLFFFLPRAKDELPFSSPPLSSPPVHSPPLPFISSLFPISNWLAEFVT